MYNKLFRKYFPRVIPTRAWICVMCFTACWTSYACRLQMPILAVPMIKDIVTNKTIAGVCRSEDDDSSRHARSVAWFDPDSHMDEMIYQSVATGRVRKLLQDEGEEVDLTNEIRTRQPGDGISLFDGRPFEWTPTIRGQLIAAYSYGNTPGNFIGGVMALKFGPRRTILWTSVLAAAISIISPFAAQVHWGVLFLMRIIIGVTGGVTFPACHQLVAKWAPPQERARFVWSLLGGTFGTILTYPMIAAIADKINWESGWYIPAVLMVIWCFVWAMLAYDSPEEHPAIADEEKEFIKSAQAGTVVTKKPTFKETPYKKIFTSVPFLSLLICHYGNLFLLFFYQNSMMLYMTKALGFELTKGGVASGLPWAARMCFGFVFCYFGDKIKSKQLVSVTVLRKGATFFSHLIPGLFLILVGYVGCDFIAANIFLILAMGFNGAASISNLSNNQDLSPNFAGLLYGIMNTVGCSAGIVIPPIVEEIAGKHGNPIHRWQTVFWIGSAVCILSMIIFLFGGSGETQPWNEIKRDDKDKDNA